MLCQICNKNPATIHVQEIINGEKKVFHLCGECASKKAETEPILQSFNLAEMLYNFTNEKAAESADASARPDAWGVPTVILFFRKRLPACWETCTVDALISERFRKIMKRTTRPRM